MQIPRYLLLPAAFVSLHAGAQTLVDSIPYPGMLNLAFWGIHVTADTIFLGSDASGAIHFSDHEGNIAGSLATPHDFNHGLIKRPDSYLIASDYTSSGATLHELDLQGTQINEWVFPPGVTGTSSGIGDLEEAGGGAIWFTMYYPDSDNYPYAYAYKWMPGSETFLDTVPLQGDQPYGIAVKGDTLYYVTDDLDGDLEKIYSYDLVNGTDLGSVDLPDTPIDNDQRPFGLHYYNGHLYLVANRQGGSAFAHQTIFIYSLDGTVGMEVKEKADGPRIFPNPANDRIVIENPGASIGSELEIFDASGKLVLRSRITSHRQSIAVEKLVPGNYSLKISGSEHSGRFTIAR